MTTVLLIRHGRTTANASGTLAGWTPGVRLDEEGQAQVARLHTRIASVPMTAVVSSPLERCRETTDGILGGRDVPVHHDERVAEVRYGDWTDQPLKTLAKDPLWKVVQQHPSAATFPGRGGESLADMSRRATDAVRHWNGELGQDAVYAVVSHGDVIKAILADALGMHLDLFQRIVVDPASVSVVRYEQTRPFVERINDTGGDLSGLARPRSTRRRSDAAVGGGSGAKARSRKRSAT